MFIKHYDDLGVEDSINQTLKLLKKNSEEKVGKNFEDMIQEFLGSVNIPDLGINNRNKLKDEIKLAKNITDFMLNLPEEAKSKMI